MTQPDHAMKIETDPEIKQTQRVNAIGISNVTVLQTLEERVSDWNKMKRIMAQVLRFIKDMQKATRKEESSTACR